LVLASTAKIDWRLTALADEDQWLCLSVGPRCTLQRQHRSEGTAMTKTMIPAKVIEQAVHLACRAPSYHNTQPWRWIVDKGELHLYVDAGRVVATDHGGRQAVISCGAALDHPTVAMAAAGHEAHVA
jgi:hypothetical protein